MSKSRKRITKERIQIAIRGRRLQRSKLKSKLACMSDITGDLDKARAKRLRDFLLG